MWWMRDECCLLYRRHGWVIISYNILWYIIIYPCLTFGTWVLCGLNTVLWWMLARAVNPLTTGKLGISQHCCYWWPEVLVSGHQQFQAWFYTFRARPVWFKQTDRVGSKSHLYEILKPVVYGLKCLPHVLVTLHVQYIPRNITWFTFCCGLAFTHILQGCFTGHWGNHMIALGQSYDCLSASEATLKDMSEWIS